jgi:hypothetical protein
MDAGLYRFAFPTRHLISARGKLCLEYLGELHEFEDLDTSFFYILAKNLQHPFPIDQWKERYPGRKAEIEQFQSYCQSGGLLLPVTDHALVSGKQIADYLLRLYPIYNDELFSHRLWKSLVDGSASMDLVKGWACETYFFILGANERMPAAIAACRSERVRSILAEHYREEWDHYKFFAESLECLGLNRQELEARGPLLSTESVMWSARKMARWDELVYVACSGLLESTGTDAARGRQFYAAVEKNYGALAPGFVAPMVKHVNLDEQYGHGSVMEEVFGGAGLVSVERAGTILQGVTEFKETLSLWFDEICNHYSPSS